MFKKKYVILIIIIIFLVLIAIYIKIKNNDAKYIGKVFSMQGVTSSKLQIIENNEQLEKLISDHNLKGDVLNYLKKYDEHFFRKKSLVIGFDSVAGGATKVTAEAEKKGKSLIVDFKIESEKKNIGGFVGYLAVFEVDKKIDKIERK